MDQLTLNFAITGMHCGSCVRRVTLALQKLDGVEVVNVNVGSAEVRVSGEGAGEKEIADAIERIGFQAARG
jgi:copper chaperone CopZ